MIKILKYLRGSLWSVALIIALLVVQAACDLALPQYTSSIVDVGIQQGGIENAVPDEIRAQSMQSLRMLMTEPERDAVDAAYTLDADGVYVLGEVDADQTAVLDDAFAMPMAIVYAASNSDALTEGAAALAQGEGATAANQAAPEMEGGTAAAALGSALLSGEAPTDEQVLALRESALTLVPGVNDTMVKQTAIEYIRQEYEAQGMDLGGIQTQYLLTTGAKMLGVTLAMVAAAILVSLTAARTAAKLGLNLRDRVFSRVVSFSSGDMDKFSTASLITRSTNDIQQVQMVTVMLLRMVIYAPILGIGGVIKVVGTNTGMGWIVFVALAAVSVLVFVLMRVAMPKFRIMQTLVDRINLIAREILTGLSVIRAFNRGEHEEERFDGANTDLMKTQLFTNRVMTLMMPAMMLIMNVVTLMIVWFGAQGIDAGNLQVGNMMAFITYTMQIVMSFLMLAMISVMLPRATVAAGRIEEVLNTEPSIQDGTDAAANARKDYHGEITFEDVSFRYPDAEENVLEGISFTAKPGQTTAIIGSTGSGKSTLLNLIPRFFDVTEGRITLDGTDIRELTQHNLRAVMGYVPQKGVLFSGDIASNIKFGGNDITDEEMVRAAKIAQADDFIEEKPEKYHDPIAQGGSNVSGGQKQRLSIARAIALEPRVLLFDDSFSALDYRTDVALRRALSEQVKDVTVIIVAQRISTILHADQILVMDEGRVVGIGTHEQLMETNETYQEIARSQLSEAELKGGKGA